MIHENLAIFFLILDGIFCFFLLTNLLQYLLHRDKAYLYYSAYLVSMIFYLTLRLSCISDFVGWFKWFCSYESFFFEIANILPITFYFLFGRFFLNLSKSDAVLDRLVQYILYTSYTYLLVDMLLHVFFENMWVNQLYMIFSWILVTASIYCVSRAFHLKSRIAIFIVIGTSFYLAGAIVSLSLDSFGLADSNQLHLIPIFYEYIGNLLECICFSIGLSYRLLAIQIETNKQLYENQKLNEKLLHIRNEIAAEMHDDLGSGLSTIRLMSEMAKIGIEQPEKKRQIERITQQANDLIESMATIIWAMNTRNDTLEGLVHYLHNYAIEFLETIGMTCQFLIPDLPSTELKQIIVGEKRRQLFLTVKEALNNIAKHAGATRVTIMITLVKDILEIHITDNGKGLGNDRAALEINPKPSIKNGNGGNGLKNMRMRIEAIDGQMDIFSKKDRGTSIILRIPTNKS